jgi:hypothetical protein
MGNLKILTKFLASKRYPTIHAPSPDGWRCWNTWLKRWATLNHSIGATGDTIIQCCSVVSFIGPWAPAFPARARIPTTAGMWHETRSAVPIAAHTQSVFRRAPTLTKTSSKAQDPPWSSSIPLLLKNCLIELSRWILLGRPNSQLIGIQEMYLTS